MSLPPPPLRRRVHLTAWLGLLALCAQLLAGSVGHWHMLQRLAGHPSLLDVCSSTKGLRQTGSDSAPDPTGSASQHCAFCLTAGHTPLPHTPSIGVARPAISHRAPVLMAQDTLPKTPDRRHAPARAPPRFV